MISARQTFPLWLIGLGITLGHAGAQEPEFPVYVGRAVCLECHGEAGTVGSCTEPPDPKHAQSYDALFTAEARDIAAISGIAEEPSRSLVCLDCHATGTDEGRRWTAKTFDIRHGVQCEACHQAGSLHVAAYDSWGKTPQSGEVRFINRGSKSDCEPCHVERPSHLAVLDLGFGLATADREYKTPVNLCVSPDGSRLYVVCEHSDSLVIVDTKRRRVINEIGVGRRPQDVAISPDGKKLYVTNRMSGTLTVIDAQAESVITHVPVGSEPHGVVVDKSGQHVVVLSTGQNAISFTDVTTLSVTRRLVAGTGPWSATVLPDGNTCYVTNVRPNPGRFRDPPESELTVLDLGKGTVTGRLRVPAANMLQGIASIPGTRTVLFTLMRTKNLVPATRLAQGWTITNGIGVAWPDGRVDQVLLDEPNAYFPDPMDVAVSPDGRTAVVTSGGSDRVAVLDVPRLLETITSMSDADRDNILPNHLGMSGNFLVKHVAVGANPRGVEFSPDGRFAYVACALEDTINIIDVSALAVVGRIELGGPSKLTQIRHGERLFHNADITFARQFSCHGCHPDGHINGLTIDIEADGVGMNPVDNRTLRGILDTPPFKWEGTNPSLRAQCGKRLAVFFTRQEPYPPAELTALVRYICTIERPPNPHRDPNGLTLQQRRGKAVFDRTTMNNGTPLALEQRCNYCHSGAYRTARITTAVASTMWFDADVDVELEDLFDTDEFGELGSYYFVDVGVGSKEFDVPHLRNIFASAPYLHNGSARTLEEIWTRFNMVNRHGMTFDLTRRQFNDLIAYLKAI